MRARVAGGVISLLLCAATAFAQQGTSAIGGKVVDQGSPQELLARYGRENMEEVFLDVARGRNEERVPGGAAVETAA